MTHPIDSVYIDNQDVAKDDIKAFVKNRQRLLLTSAAEITTMNVGTQIGIDMLGVLYNLDAADTTTAHDGKSCLVSLNGKRFKRPSDPPVAGRNLIINGAFNIWQRGTSTSANVSYAADRWFFFNNGVGTSSASRIDISALGIGSQYAIRIERTAGTDKFVIGTTSETSVIKKLLGKTVTLSFKLRKGSALTSNIGVTFGTQNQEAKFGTLVDNGSFTVTNASLNTSTFTKFSRTLTIPAGSSALGLKLEFEANQAGAANAYYDLAEVQLEIGSYASEFDHRPVGEELQLCKRYYQKFGGDVTTDIYVTSYTTASGVYAQSFILPVEMRAAPTFTKFGTWFVNNSSQPTLGAATGKLLQLYGTATITGTCAFASLDNTQYITLDSEL